MVPGKLSSARLLNKVPAGVSEKRMNNTTTLEELRFRIKKANEDFILRHEEFLNRECEILRDELNSIINSIPKEELNADVIRVIEDAMKETKALIEEMK